MQRGREIKDIRDPFDIFGSSGQFGGFGSSIFENNPFDDPFFRRPFGSVLSQSGPLDGLGSVNEPKEPVIQELKSDDERDGDDEDDISGSKEEPFVCHPDDEPNDRKSRGVNRRTGYGKTGGTQNQTFKFHSSKVTYGGVDGTYYSSSATRRIGSDGVLMEECKEADGTTGEALHRVSRGIHDKGHSVTRKLNVDGKVDSKQILHNLNEDELTSFEEAWKGRNKNHLPGWLEATNAHENTGSRSGGLSDEMANWGRLLLPSSGQRAWGTAHGKEGGNSSSEGKANKKIVRINIE